MPVKAPKANTTPFYPQGVRKCLPTPPSPCFLHPQSHSLLQLCLPGEPGTAKLLRALSSDSSAGGFSSHASPAYHACKVLPTGECSQSPPAEPSRTRRCSPESCKYGFKTLASPVQSETPVLEKTPSPHVSNWGAHPHLMICYAQVTTGTWDVRQGPAPCPSMHCHSHYPLKN